MSTRLSQKQIGKRLAELRKLKGLSQEDLAKSISISRPSLAQIELGNRSVDILEFQQFSQVLGFSLDDFMSKNFSVLQAVRDKEEKKPKKSTERVAVPKLQVAKFKNVLLYMLEHCAGKPNVGEVVLHHLLYFADFNYYELYEEHLTGAKYRKLPQGPVPQSIDTMMRQMIDSGQLQRVKSEFRGQSQIRYLPLVKADLTELKASEKEVIDKVIEQMGDWPGTVISEYARRDKPWKAEEEGEEISYELVFYRRPPHSVRVYEEDEQD